MQNKLLRRISEKIRKGSRILNGFSARVALHLWEEMR